MRAPLRQRNPHYEWAARQQTSKPADKLVLFGLADTADFVHATAHPSHDWLIEFSGLDRRSVRKALRSLVAQELISDTGHRMGQSSRVIVWRLASYPFNASGEG